MQITWGRRIFAALLTGFILALIVQLAIVVLTNVGYIGTNTAGWPAVAAFTGFFAIASAVAFVLLAVAGLLDVFTTWWASLIVAVVIGVIATSLCTMIYVAAALGQRPTIDVIWNLLGERNLAYVALLAALVPTFGRWLYHRIAHLDTAATRGRRIALVRIPSPRLAEGVVTNIEPSSIDSAKADEQWDAYVKQLADAGWQTVEVGAAEQHPDSVFVEDTAVVFGGLAVVARPGAASRAGEVVGTEATLIDLGLDVAHIEEPGTLDGGDVLRVGRTLYVGRSDRTNAEGVRQLRALAAEVDHTVVAVPVKGALHLKSVATALPDGTVIGDAELIADPSVFDRFLPVPEHSGAAVVPLADDTVLLAASAPKTAELLADLGYRVVSVDVSEFEKLEGGVSCLSILVR
jgi:dimethylargininase